VVVLAAGQDVLGTVELFGEDQADQLVREHQLGQRPGEVRPRMNGWINAVGSGVVRPG